MTVSIRETNLQVISAEDLTSADKKYKILDIAGTIAGATPRSAAGPLVTSVKSGGHATAVIEGITKVWAGGAVNSIGWPWTCAASGWTAVVASGGYSCGRYLATCASGDLVLATVDLHNVNYQGAP